MRNYYLLLFIISSLGVTIVALGISVVPECTSQFNIFRLVFHASVLLLISDLSK